MLKTEINQNENTLSFGEIPQIVDMPYLIETQKKSYFWFLEEGMRQNFAEISPIEDFTGNLILEFSDYSFGPTNYTIEECKERDMTFAVPLKVRVRLITKEQDDIKDIKVQEVFMGDFPFMTPNGTFVINGAERVVVSQLARSPGVYFQGQISATGKTLYESVVIPNRGAWLEFETDQNDVIGVRIDKTRKLPATILVRALGYGTDQEILDLFEGNEFIKATMAKDGINNQKDALIEVYKRLRPGDPPTVESARNLIKNLFFDHKRYNLARVGRYKLNKKLGILIDCENCGTMHKSGTVSCPDCGANINYKEELTESDIISVIKYIIKLMEGKGKVDDIDHLGNRRVRAVGELLLNQFRVGLLRLERVVRERMSVQDIETVTPQALINIRPVIAAIKEFFGSSQLSQFMDQTNSLAELVHKRRLSALGPGGLSRERAGFEVRDVHHSHYGRICPIETPEGPNIGLIGSLATYAKINDFGFIMAPYRVVKDGFVTNEVLYLTADEEEDYNIAQANTLLDKSGRIIEERIPCGPQPIKDVPKKGVTLMDLSPKQLFSVATNLIPFLENDDANRALMGANMQKQAVPLIKPESPIVGTGMEWKAAMDSGAVVISEFDGEVTYVDATKIKIKNDVGKEKPYSLLKFWRSNAGTCINQRPIVSKGDRVKAGQIIADGASSVNGKLGLGRNVFVAFCPWQGYNFEDAILISEELVKEDVYTSIHIEEYDCEARDTKLGPEEITRDIPNLGEEALRNLDERGIIRIGADVTSEDVLVGKVTPKGETELTAEERLLRAIFGEKARDVRDTSLRVRHGEKGKVIDVKVFSRDEGHELSPGVNKLARVYVAQKRKIMTGDKMAGRHGNKGVIAKVLPIEEMPYLPDGMPVQIVLNPLGVPSRMNIGQVLETHLGLAIKELGFEAECPVFDGPTEDDIKLLLKKAHLKKSLEGKGLYFTREQLDELVRIKTPLAFLTGFFRDEGVVLSKKDKQLLSDNDNWEKNLKKLLKDNKIDLSNEQIRNIKANRPMENLIKEVFSQSGKTVSEKDVKDWVEFMESLDPGAANGKTILYDGRTGEPFANEVTVGYIYMLKLAHLVDDKIHARSTGPYSLITQQPLGGKAQFGGQRFGEMEVWALEAYGAAYTLQELLTVKSDDVVGRVKTYEAIVRGENVQEPGIPESFKVLLKELQSLCLDVKLLSEKKDEVEIKSFDDDIKATARELGIDIGEEALNV